MEGDSFEALDNNMDTSKTSACEQLCIEQQEDGCCFLGNEMGCYWKGGASVSSYTNDTWMSVKCSITGTLPPSLR